MPWLRRLVAGLLQRRPGFNPGPVHVGFVVEKVSLWQVFPPSTSVIRCQLHYTDAQSLGKTEKLIIFITRLHNKPQGCGASVASAAGPFTTKQKTTFFSTSSKTLFGFLGSHHQCQYCHIYKYFVVIGLVLMYLCSRILVSKIC
jgi:hypothetical protein